MSKNSKDNANPIVHAIQHSKRKSSITFEEFPKRESLRDEILEFYGDVHILPGNASSNSEHDEQERICGSNISANDKSILMALAACSDGSTRSDGDDALLKIVNDAGFPIDVAKDRMLGPAIFRPSAAAAASDYGAETPIINEAEDTTSTSTTFAVTTTTRDEIDSSEIFELIRDINDPEHPLTLEQLNVVSEDLITVVQQGGHPLVDIRFTPTIPHCSMATLIGLCLRVKLIRSLPPRYKCTVRITPGSHASEFAVNKQLADKERVAAALENKHLLGVVNKCIG
mmetsp:Transcript_18391/g.28660  ORF Transcript_18391/g.28660 Transcript_18391/m.28660 type:complete len:285 (+) Transcript_18391:44-898(+)|eukprot:CAMPEP_0196807492 /NCGR_PEP_ID=MMETSP1362-20130617/7474_1 /TAXON_ID=163516 /ORGANISM="Leptocylindrus danicus, Strain CCMP1856" /LENGTH=284 /DNA_ID=CAMNT_0042181441 /DNA_START=27 /DNA_END=881 /DNA_ORIENTATION=+